MEDIFEEIACQDGEDYYKLKEFFGKMWYFTTQLDGIVYFQIRDGLEGGSVYNIKDYINREMVK